jgi:hypothetical protein
VGQQKGRWSRGRQRRPLEMGGVSAWEAHRVVWEEAMEEEKGFVVKDKRTFSSETGQSKPEASQEDEGKKASEEEPVKQEEKAKVEKEEPIQLPEVTFATFVFSLSSSALLHFGEVPDPTTGQKSKNLPMAKHTIDILGMLEEKTKGNLSDDESQLLTNILYDLRMRYVKENT